MRQLFWRFSWVLALFVAALAMGCQQTENLPVPPDTRIDKTVFALVPVRAAYVKPSAPIADEDARKVENALRMTYAPVECTGPKARVSMNLILGATRSSPDLVRRNGRRIVVVSGGAEPVTYDDCKVVGSHLVGGASLLKIFSRAAKSDEEFAFQQTLWLAIREPWRLHAGVLSGDFYTFLAEHLGAVPNADRTVASLDVLQLDRTFNPCSTDKAPGARDKNVFFKCVGLASYANTRALASHKNKLLSLIARAETKYLKSLAASPLADGPEVEGMTAALRATGSPYDIVVRSTSGGPAVAGAPPSSVADNAVSAATATNVVKLDGSALQKALGLRTLRAPDPVISASNPRVTSTPPAMYPDAASPTSGTPDQNGWQKMGDTYFAVRGDSYVTAKVVAGANGPVYRTSVWQVMGQNYWSGDLGRSTWQYSAARSQFWRRAFNGNPFDFGAGQLATGDGGSGVKVRSNPVGATTGTLTLPKGWKLLADGTLKDPAGQIWIWKPALGAYVKLNPSTGPPSSGGSSSAGSTGSASSAGTASAGPQPPACGCTASAGGSSATGTSGTGTGTGSSGTGTSGTGTGGTGGTGTGGTAGGNSTTGGSDVAPATTGIDAFRSDYNNAHPDGPQLQGSAADQQALISTAGSVQDYSDVARALPYGGNRVGPDGTSVGDTYSSGYTKNEDGTTTADGTRNICGDISFNTSQGLNALGINSGQVAVQFQNTEGTTDYHAVNWIQTGTDMMGQATYQFYDPQTGQATGTGYTNATEGIQALGQAAGGSYNSMGDWSVSTAAGGIIGPGQTFTAPANTGGGQQDGSNSPNGTAGQWLNNYQSGQTPDARTGDGQPTTPPTSQAGGDPSSGGDKAPTAQPSGPGSSDSPSNPPASSTGSSDTSTGSSTSDDTNGSDDAPDTTGSAPAAENPPPDTGESFPDDGGDTSGGGNMGGDVGGDYGGGDYSGGSSEEENVHRLHLVGVR